MNSELYFMGIIFLVLIVLIFILVEAVSIRNSRDEKYSINCFSTVHRIFVQKKGLLAEDFIAITSLAVFGVFLYLFLSLRFSFGFGALADNDRPTVAVVEDPAAVHEPVVRVIPAKNMVERVIVTEVVEQSTYDRGEDDNFVDFIDYLGGDLDPQAVTVVETRVPQEFLVKTYEEAVFASLPAKVQTQIFAEFEDLHVLQGNKVNLGSEGNLELLVSDHEIGDFAVSDPTLVQPAGEFEVRVKAKLLSDTTFGGEIFRLLVVDEHEAQVLSEQSFTVNDFKQVGEWGYLKSVYNRDFTGSVQVRGVFLKKADMAFDNFEIIPTKINKVSNGVRSYVDVVDTSTGNEKARVARFRIDLPGRIAFGPYDEDIPAGKFRAKFRLKIDNRLASSQNIALIDVSSNLEDFVPVYKFIKGSDFKSGNVYQNFALDFDKSAGGYLEFRVYYYGGGDLYLDKIDLFEIK